MRVLLLHPEDELGSCKKAWDLIMDFGRVPASIYERWRKQAGCPVLSIYDFATEIDDLRAMRQTLQAGMGVLTDEHGIDWWDVLSLGIVSDLQQLTLLNRLAKELNTASELDATRAFPLATLLQNRLGCTLHIQSSRSDTFRRKCSHYWNAFSNLNGAQLSQVLQDKFDRQHTMRQKFSRVRTRSKVPVVLLPSAYVNVSRTAADYAQLLPGQQFLLVLARRAGALRNLPANISAVSLDRYFLPINRAAPQIVDKWRMLRRQLTHSSWIFEAADRAGVLDRIEGDFRWGLRIRDAWVNVFETEQVAGCLSADDTNPYTRIPLVLASARQVPSVACHHGALDCWMALKNPASDWYLAKSEMEMDYLMRQCQVAPEKLLLGAPTHSRQPAFEHAKAKDAIVFFTEPYAATGWRTPEVYANLLPHLVSLARNCGLKLIFKLHPFESIRGHRRLLRQVLGNVAREIEILSGPARDDLWQGMSFALTAQSSVALECAARGLPVFLCAWLRDPFSGYVEQFEKFEIGLKLESPEQIADIPGLLGTKNPRRLKPEPAMNPDILRQLLTARHRFASAVSA